VAEWLRSVDAERIIRSHQLGGQPGHCICGAQVSRPWKSYSRWRQSLPGHLFDVIADEIEGRPPPPVKRRRGETP
jgi:hypothetical protein